MKVVLENSALTSWTPGKNAYERFLYDFKLIQKWMTTPSDFRPALKHLDGVVKRTRKLTAELLAREQNYGLNAGTIAPIYTAVLDGAEFVAMNRRGALPKDHVTPEHGEYTHRLHWYIVLYNATAGFTKAATETFCNTPLSLLKATTKKDYYPPKSGWPQPMKDAYETTNFSTWEALFDRRPQAEFYSLDEDHISCPEMFTALLVPPSATRPTLLAYQKLALKAKAGDQYLSLAPEVPDLSAIISARYDKRAGESSTIGPTWPAWYARRKTGQALVTDAPGDESDSDDENDYQFLTTKKGVSKSVLVEADD